MKLIKFRKKKKRISLALFRDLTLCRSMRFFTPIYHTLTLLNLYIIRTGQHGGTVVRSFAKQGKCCRFASWPFNV